MSITNKTPILLVLVLFCSCVDTEDYDFNNLEEAEWSPTYALPIANGELGLEDLLSLEDSATLGVREDDVFFFEYEDRFESADLAEQIEIPDVDFRRSLRLPTTLFVPPNSAINLPPIQGEIVLEAESQFRSIDYKSGQLEYVVSSNLDVPVEIDIIFPAVTEGENALGVSAEVSGNRVMGSESLAGYTADLTTGSRQYNTIPFRIELAAVNNTDNPIRISAGEAITAELSLRQQDFSYVEGFFGNLNLELPEMILPIGPFDELLKYDMQLSEMDLQLQIHNQYGVPISLSLPQFMALNASGEALEIETSPDGPFILEGAESPGEESTTLIEVVNGNELIRHDPEKIRIGARAALNEGRSEGSNFIVDNSHLVFDLSAEIPLVGSFRDLEIRDTIDADLRNSFEELDIQRIELRPELVNEFPLEGNFQIYMLGENNQILDSLLLPGQTDIIRPSRVDAQGDLLEPGVFDQIIQISDEKFEALRKTTRLIISARLNTVRGADDSSPSVRFKSQYKLHVELGAVAEIETTITP